jgi:hypothetical protein
MASRTSISWLRHDLRLAYVMLVWAAFAFSFFYLFSGGIKQKQHQQQQQQQQQQAKTVQSDDEIYTGSITFVPSTGDRCWQMMLDNRTGRMWETGYVDCSDAVKDLAEIKRSGTVSSRRIQSISNAFRGD